MTEAMPDAGPGSTGPARSSDLVLARVHLRLGSLELARAELETLAGHDLLDEDGLVDLAEARWRTGDIEGAGEAALAALDDDDGPIVALVVAAEAAAARGRPTEARRYADRAMGVANGSIDTIFAGMPRAPAWPPDPAAPPPSPTTMFDPPHGPAGSVSRPPHRPAEPVAAGASVAPSAPAVEGTPASADAAGADAPVPAPAGEMATIGMWDDVPEDQPRDEAAGYVAAAPPGTRSENEHLLRGQAALESGDIDTAVVSLSLVLRLEPVAAPSVIDLVAGRTDPALALVRGDAYRLVGRELDALSAYREAARVAAAHDAEIHDDPAHDEPPQGDPA